MKRKQEADEALGFYMRDGKIMVTSIEGMKSWLKEVSQDTTPALMQTMQSQLQLLNYVQSASMTGMALDNMILCLGKAINSTSKEKEKANIREAFAMMFQNYFFFQEANIRCAEMKNQQESADLLKQAGCMLSEAVTKTTVAVSSGPIDTNALIVKNIFDSEDVRKGYLKSVFVWFADKKQLRQKQTEYWKTLEDIFATYDEHAELLGKSVLTRGMLRRYRKELVARHKNDRIQQYVDHSATIDTNSIAELTNGISSIVKGAMGVGKNAIVAGTTQSLGAIAAIAANVINDKKKGLDIDAYCLLEESLQREINSMNSQYATLDAELKDLMAQLAEADLMQVAFIKELQAQIEEKKAEIAVIKPTLQGLKDKLNDLKATFPDAHAIREDIICYDNHLKRVEDKF